MTPRFGIALSLQAGIAVRGLLPVVLALALWACAPERASPPGESDEDLKDLVALPYLSWSEEQVDPEQLGVTVWDKERSFEGINLYTNDVNELYLMDMSGRRLHSWILPDTYKHCEHFELLPGGEALAVCEGQALVRLDWESKLLWANDLTVHHDVAVVPDGSILVAHSSKLREYQGRRVGFDVLAHLSAEGRLLDQWRTFDHLDELHQHHPPSHLDKPPTSPPKKGYDYYHMNTVEVLPETPLGRADPRFQPGNILICLRNAHLIAILDRDTKRVTWSWGPGQLSFPHMPTMLPDGNLLVFDNGVSTNSSRVLELEPRAKEVVWRYEADPPRSFFTKRRGSSQRLPNGNTLICESDKGHVFEVTRAGETVWRFWNPELKGKRRKRIYRFMRMPEQEVRQLVRTGR